MATDSKRILYIAGCGRSGTTILGFSLGSCSRTIDLGEVLDFVRFKGRPNGFEHDTENYKFWNQILHDVDARLNGLDFARLADLQSRFDTHQFMLRKSIFRGEKEARELAEYQTFLKVLYGRLLEDDRFDVIIDSSKYPSRLQHLLQLFPGETVCVIHLMRNPIELAKAFRKTEQSGRKTFAEAIFYYFVVNSFIQGVVRTSGLLRCRRVYFEQFIANPTEQVRRVATAFGLDATEALRKIEHREPLPCGYIFNGNRMRIQNAVRLDFQPLEVEPRTFVERATERALAAWFKS